MNGTANIAYRAEIARKMIHFSSLSIPVVYSLIDRSTAVAILLPLTLAFIAVDLLRYYHPPTSKLFYTVFAFMLRSHEKDPNAKRLNGASNVLIAATICVLLFPKVIVLTAFPILIISDSVAALFGRRFGKRPFLKKSLEGSSAFFVSAVIVTLLTPKAGLGTNEFVIGAAGAFVGTIAEAGAWKVDDNLAIPLSVGIVMWVLYLLLFPGIDPTTLMPH